MPVLRDAAKKGLLEIASLERELARKAREGTPTVDEVTGGTFTISSVGMFQVDGVRPASFCKPRPVIWKIPI